VVATQVSTADKIKCLQRELALRRNVYPLRVLAGKMNQLAADYEIEVMEAILDDYKRTDKDERSDARRAP
jgi:hypothetical protein